MKILKGKYVNGTEPKYCNGAYGGPGMGDEVILHFYFERFDMPEGFQINVGKEEINEQNIYDTDIDFVRDVKSTIVMPLSSAKEVYALLGNLIEEQEQNDMNSGKDDE
ncbi:MAG: hypothetical protein PHX62_03340 [Bacilli bacterium]|nr:hypothetical protein [Bacilli bacterium]